MVSYTNGNLAYQAREKETVQKKTVTKVKKSTMPIREKLFYLVMVLLVVVVASVIISNYAQIVEYNYLIQKQEQAIKAIQLENESLQLKIANLSSPERILSIAQKKLGMKLNEEQIVMLSNQLHNRQQ
ncbi:cell division protein FtsL [Tepidibacillus fermentans]|uniref:Cell division protein FtsL n=1 Tax=Tepidibacillus fermentans TaxID=1281767 RepID=A0A4R3KKK4_9BACI|nr:cell division protein FtsL [Tepidibacillus fermentans]TCS84421.1 cell division protein FtsL [Tepidibacillus fermentans]